MATRFAGTAATLHPVDRRAVGETTAARPWIDGDIAGGHRFAAAILLSVTGVLFLAPPTAALLVLTGLLR
jgi:heme O synthase-like polyprenyltransferase